MNEGYIEGSHLIPIDTLEEDLSIIPADIPLVVYCRSGGRSARAASILVSNGFKEDYDLGGISDWISAGFPVVTGEG